jgi:hypothetical protein
LEGVTDGDDVFEPVPVVDAVFDGVPVVVNEDVGDGVPEGVPVTEEVLVTLAVVL